MSQQHAAEYIRFGQIPFFRLPTADFAKTGPQVYEGANVVLLGVPFDGGTTYQPGARLAPYEIRRVSALLQSYHPVHRVDVFETLRALDGGNVAFPPFNPGMVREAVQAEVAAVLGAGAVPVMVGGDHSITLPVLRAIAAAQGPVNVVHIDAHFDTSSAELWGEPYHHGTPFRHALDEGLIVRGGLRQIGVRATWGGADEADFGAKHGAVRIPMEQIAPDGLHAVGRAIAGALEDRPVYISLDIDAIDPAFAPGTGTPVPGGLTSREAIQLLRGLAGANIVGMDLVEVCPALDHADMTVHLAAHLLFEGLALVAMRGKRRAL